MYYSHYTYTEDACKMLRDNKKLNVHLISLVVGEDSLDQEIIKASFVVIPEDVYAENYRLEIDLTSEVFNDECDLDEVANITSSSIDTRISLRIAYLIYKVQRSVETDVRDVIDSLTKYVKEINVGREPLKAGYCEDMSAHSLD